jgi:hypothetical protein
MAEEGAAGMAAVLPGGLPAAGPGPPAMGALAAPGTGAAVAPAMTWTNKQRRRITTVSMKSWVVPVQGKGHYTGQNRWHEPMAWACHMQVQKITRNHLLPVCLCTNSPDVSCEPLLLTSSLRLAVMARGRSSHLAQHS